MSYVSMQTRSFSVVGGHPFMMFTRKSGFWPPPLVHMRPHEPGPLPSMWTSTSTLNTHRSLDTASTMTFQTKS